MNNKIVVLVFVLVSLAGYSQKKVLWLGNSYTGVNNLPYLTDQIANSLGDDMEYDSNTPGGHQLQQHASNATSLAKITSQAWDVVIIQAQSQEPSFPHTQVHQNTFPYARVLNDSIQSNNSCTETMFYMTWGRETGDPQWDSINTFDKMNNRLQLAYEYMANDNDASVAPVGVAWKYIRDNYPSIQLYTGDGSHPSYAGSYLAGSVFYANIFNKHVMDATFIGSLDSTTASILRRVADSVVFEGNYEQWHNGSKNIALFDGYQLDQTMYWENNSIGEGLTFKWMFGDGNESTDANPTHQYVQDGTYEVVLISYSPCGNDTIRDSVTFTTVGIEEQEINFHIWQSSSNELTIASTDNQYYFCRLIDINGRVIESFKMSGVESVDVRQKGLVIVELLNEKGKGHRQKLIVR